MFNALPLLLRLALLVGLAGLLTGAYLKWADHIGDKREASVRAVYDSAIAKQKAEAKVALAEATEKAGKLTEQLASFKINQEKRDAKNSFAVESLRSKLLVTGLRDPYATGCRSSGASPSPDVSSVAGAGSGNSASGGGVLSTELADFLRQQALTADSINLAYASCRNTLLNDREVLK